MPIGWVIGGASLLGSVLGANASESAANTQANAANNASANTMAMFNTQQANLAPWMQSGQAANSALQNWLGVTPGTTSATGQATPASLNMSAPGMQQFNPSMLASQPGYQFQLQQGNDAILANSSAMGGVLSGNTGVALQNYAQGLAGTNYQTALQDYNTSQQNIYNMLSGMSNTGANTAGGIAGLGMNAVNSAGQNSIGAANALASGTVGAANSINGALGSGVNNYLMYNMAQQNAANNMAGGNMSGYMPTYFDPSMTPGTGYGGLSGNLGGLLGG